MNYYNSFEKHFAKLEKGRKKIDNTIYTFDIETTSYLILDGKQIPACEYLNLSPDEQESCEFRSCMYIWQFSIDDKVYYGRTWQELRVFLDKLYFYNPHKKILFIHNASFEFQYLKDVFEVANVFSRKTRKVIKFDLPEYNFEVHCSYYMSNCKLENLPSVFNLSVEKQVGSLNYDLIRHNETKLTTQELNYCKYDCLVVYEYIKKELETYKYVDKIPITSTGHVRRELKQRVYRDFEYKHYVKKAININPHVYNLLIRCI